MIDQFFSNADYYKNKEFQTNMRNWNYFMKDKELEDKEIQNMIEEIIIGDFYRSAKEWLYSVDKNNTQNYDSLEWRRELE